MGWVTLRHETARRRGPRAGIQKEKRGNPVHSRAEPHTGRAGRHAMDRRRFLELSLVTVAGGKLAACSHGGGDEAALAPVLSQTVAYAFDNAGNRYEMDFEAYVVRRVDANGNVVWTQGDVANPDLFNSPTSMAIDNDGTVFVADRGNGEIERLSAAGTPLATF